LIIQILSFGADSNNFLAGGSRGGGSSSSGGTAGVGEREGRCYSSIVRDRHFGLSHGIGRSGDIGATQPKAIGNSIIAKMTKCLVRDALRIVGVTNLLDGGVGGGNSGGSGSSSNAKKKKGDDSDYLCLLPCATGMSLSLTLMAAAREFFDEKNVDTEVSSKSFIIWSRIDQKSCLKAMTMITRTFGKNVCELLIVDPVMMKKKKKKKAHGDEKRKTSHDDDDGDHSLVTDVEAINRLIFEKEASNIIAICTTTSCFAPRAPDNILSVSSLCAEHGICHIVNNAYGLQCRNIIMKEINTSLSSAAAGGNRRKYRLDAFVQSMDKNLNFFCGAIVAGRLAP
jgi:O-phospho-L-seryl-tRNASec:L-selenocysteinyl-tRNA synthase